MADEKKPGPDLSGRDSAWGKLDAGMRAAGNFLTLGTANKLEAGMQAYNERSRLTTRAVASVMTAGYSEKAIAWLGRQLGQDFSLKPAGTYQQHLADAKAIDAFDEKHHPEAVLTGMGVGAGLGLASPAGVGRVLAEGANGLKAAKIFTGSAEAGNVAAATAAGTVATGAATTAATVSTGTVAGAAAATAEAAAGAAATSRTARVAQAAVNAVKHPISTAAGAAIGVGRATVMIGIPGTVAFTMLDAATDAASDGRREPVTTEEIKSVDAGTVQGGLTTAVAAQAAKKALPVVEKAAGRAVEGLAGRYARLFRLGEAVLEKVPSSVQSRIGGLVAEGANLAKVGATTVATGIGLGVAGGEVGASLYVTHIDSNSDIAASYSNQVRDAYAGLKEKGLALRDDGTFTGVMGSVATTLTTEFIESHLPATSQIIDKEKKLLFASNADFSDPQMRQLASRHMSGELMAISQEIRHQQDQNGTLSLVNIAGEDIAQNERRMRADFNKTWAPVTAKIDTYLLSSKADYTNPEVIELLLTRINHDRDALDLKYALRISAKPEMQNDPRALAALERERDVELVSLQQKWEPAKDRVVATLSGMAPASVAGVHQQASPEAHPSPQGQFNAQAVAPSAPQDSAPAGGLIPSSGQIPPLVAPPGSIDTSGLRVNAADLSESGTKPMHQPPPAGAPKPQMNG